MVRLKTLAVAFWVLVGVATLGTLLMMQAADTSPEPALEPDPEPVFDPASDPGVEGDPDYDASTDAPDGEMVVADEFAPVDAAPECTADVWTCKALEKDWAVFIMTGVVVTKGVAGAVGAVKALGRRKSRRESRREQEERHRVRRLEERQDRVLALLEHNARAASTASVAPAAPLHPLAQPRRRAYRPVTPRLADDTSIPRHRAA